MPPHPVRSARCSFARSRSSRGGAAEAQPGASSENPAQSAKQPENYKRTQKDARDAPLSSNEDVTADKTAAPEAAIEAKTPTKST